jgi:hypothetical protein
VSPQQEEQGGSLGIENSLLFFELRSNQRALLKDRKRLDQVYSYVLQGLAALEEVVALADVDQFHSAESLPRATPRLRIVEYFQRVLRSKEDFLQVSSQIYDL